MRLDSHSKALCFQCTIEEKGVNGAGVASRVLLINSFVCFRHIYPPTKKKIYEKEFLLNVSLNIYTLIKKHE